MQIEPGTPTSPFTIEGVSLIIPLPFKEGHVCNEADAGVLNQVVAENVRNNLREAVKELKTANPDADVTAAVQTAVDKYVSEYKFGERRSGPRLDPVESQALELAVGVVKRRALEAGEKLADLGTAELKERARKMLDDAVLGQKFRDRAKIIVDASVMD
jgi:hypothetical protein